VTNMSARDRKMIMVVVPLVVIVAYWFLLLSPKREESASAKKDMTEQQDRLAAARALSTQANGAKTDFAADYGEIVRLGKAIPARVDMPSLLVQLDRAAAGTDITFTKISQGERTPLVPVAAAGAVGSVTPPADQTGAGAEPTTPPATGTPVAAGGEAAQSAPGTATEAANNAAATSNQANSAAEQSGVDATTSTSTGGGLPIGGGAATPNADGTVPVANGGLETVPLELEFVGNFFHLADFFHDIKRFVHVANNSVVVNGRLVTIEGVDFASDPLTFPRIKATLKAKVYLSPLGQGVTAGATTAGPAATTPAATPATATPAPAEGTAPATTPAPTAAVTP